VSRQASVITTWPVIRVSRDDARLKTRHQPPPRRLSPGKVCLPLFSRRRFRFSLDQVSYRVHRFASTP
jgi:hypothetical protein